MSKQYGLIIPNKGHKLGTVSSVKPSIFNDSDSDTESSKPKGFSKTVKRQDIINQQRAIEEDPTVYQYDEIYDKMEQEKIETKLSRKDLDKKPKYIGRLLATAEKRKRENERRIERQVQKEREEEGEQFKDKESFVTSAYKQKLQELRELEEQEKTKKSVTLQNKETWTVSTGTYMIKRKKRRRLSKKNQRVKEKKTPDRKSSSRSPSPKKRRSSESNSECEKQIKRKTDLKNRKYRTRKESDEEEKSDPKMITKKVHLQSNLDADSDFSIDSSDSEESEAEGKKETKKEINKVKDVIEPKEIEETTVKTEEVTENKEIEVIKEEQVEVKPKKPKVDIWKKRTVGEKFDEALRRYFERKAQRETGL
ncbi:hypothetical protein NQ317_018227 [Molorchus minor]|uniref:Nuclear speckle splicing regulatory protein 1 N-terminal domain-containing protein n=1 Tax=Molorchus minor TaxID=1323400 RepID=A0ABQ9K443_9CUCU|nr:hypothetical protein NQ317_018227 [Molorchus minor]